MNTNAETIVDSTPQIVVYPGQDTLRIYTAREQDVKPLNVPRFSVVRPHSIVDSLLYRLAHNQISNPQGVIVTVQPDEGALGVTEHLLDPYAVSMTGRLAQTNLFKRVLAVHNSNMSAQQMRRALRTVKAAVASTVELDSFIDALNNWNATIKTSVKDEVDYRTKHNMTVNKQATHTLPLSIKWSLAPYKDSDVTMTFTSDVVIDVDGSEPRISLECLDMDDMLADFTLKLIGEIVDPIKDKLNIIYHS